MQSHSVASHAENHKASLTSEGWRNESSAWQIIDGHDADLKMYPIGTVVSVTRLVITDPESHGSRPYFIKEGVHVPPRAAVAEYGVFEVSMNGRWSARE